MNDTPAEDGADDNALVPAELNKTLKELLKAQAQDVALKSEQLELETRRLDFDKQKDQNALKFGLESLAAQERDRQHSRNIARDEKRDGHRLFVIVVIVIALLVAYALYLDKDKIAEELVKAIVFLAAGAAAGYGIANKSKSDNTTTPTKDPKPDG